MYLLLFFLVVSIIMFYQLLNSTSSLLKCYSKSYMCFYLHYYNLVLSACLGLASWWCHFLMIWSQHNSNTAAKSAKSSNTITWPNNWKMNLCLKCFGASSTASSSIVLYLAPLIYLPTLISFPVSAEEKHPHSLMLPPQCFSVNMLFKFVCSVRFSLQIMLCM